MAGRPRIYNDVDELQKAVDSYFEFIVIADKKPSVTGLALHLGFADKTTLYEYRDRPEFSYPIKRGLLMVEQYHEERLDANSVTGSIFALKNMGWKDKQEIEANNTHSITWNEERSYEADNKTN